MGEGGRRGKNGYVRGNNEERSGKNRRTELRILRNTSLTPPPPQYFTDPTRVLLMASRQELHENKWRIEPRGYCTPQLTHCAQNQQTETRLSHYKVIIFCKYSCVFLYLHCYPPFAYGTIFALAHFRQDLRGAMAEKISHQNFAPKRKIQNLATILAYLRRKPSRSAQLEKTTRK